MSYFQINGGRRLRGELNVQGAKNSVLPILAATVLLEGQSVIKNCPRLRDVDITLQILRHLGCKVTRNGNEITVDASTVTCADVPHELMDSMRSSIVFMGALLARCGEATAGMPGGCDIGLRPIDLHLNALGKLGAEIYTEGGRIVTKAERLKGCDIALTFPSVGATENAMLAASRAEGLTRIQNAACEPEIVDLARFLMSCGVRVGGAGTPTISIRGGLTAREVTHTVIADRIVAATYMAAVAAAGGEVWLNKVDTRQCGAVIAALTQAGCRIEIHASRLYVEQTGRLQAVPLLKTMPYPGFPTDAQAPLMAALTKAQGTSVVVETIFENRYRHVGELARMGADIKIEGRAAVVMGVEALQGARVESPDLRSGAALVVAGLGANGTTQVNNIKYIDRGYDRLEDALVAIGADIVRVQG
ncbi:MAG: UDP-N-acetylglucosamine 1-carboxyvinyltransferase [Oscillospiraceae bacterium]|nr:UDP-N-acetylglucosamine 1-carboxyvinyltransferase [Oscillospiraceae bacterium]